MVTTRSGLRTHSRPTHKAMTLRKTYPTVGACLRDVYRACYTNTERRVLVKFAYEHAYEYADGWVHEWTFRETAMYLTNSDDPRVYMPVYDMLVCRKEFSNVLSKREYKALSKVLRTQLLSSVSGLTNVVYQRTV